MQLSPIAVGSFAALIMVGSAQYAIAEEVKREALQSSSAKVLVLSRRVLGTDETERWAVSFPENIKYSLVRPKPSGQRLLCGNANPVVRGKEITPDLTSYSHADAVFLKPIKYSTLIAGMKDRINLNAQLALNPKVQITLSGGRHGKGFWRINSERLKKSCRFGKKETNELVEIHNEIPGPLDEDIKEFFPANGSCNIPYQGTITKYISFIANESERFSIITCMYSIFSLENTCFTDSTYNKWSINYGFNKQFLSKWNEIDIGVRFYLESITLCNVKIGEKSND